LPDRFNQKNQCVPIFFYRGPAPAATSKPARIQKSPGTSEKVPGDFLQSSFFIKINLLSDPD